MLRFSVERRVCGGGGGLTFSLEIIGGEMVCPANRLAAIVAERVHASLDAQPAEVALESARDVGLAAGCGVSGRGAGGEWGVEGARALYLGPWRAFR